MKTRGWKMDDGVRQTQSVIECGGKRSATPLSPTPRLAKQSQPSSARKLRRRCALPEQSKICRHFVALLCLSTIILLLSTPTSQAQYAIDWHTIDGGGGTGTNGQYAVSGTIGQPDAGLTMTNGSYTLTGGFWALINVMQTPGAPTLTIAPATPGNATVSWTPNTPGFVLQERASLSAGSWTNSPSGATNPVIVPATLPTKFYRLNKP